MRTAVFLVAASVSLAVGAEVFNPQGGHGCDLTGQLAAALAKAKDGGVLFLPRGRYFISGAVAVQDINDFTLRGEPGTVIVTHVSPTGIINVCNAALKVRRAKNFRMENIVFTSDEPTGAAGRIAALDPEAGTFDVEISEPFPVTGKEHVASLDSCSDAGMPDRRLSLTGRLVRKTDSRGRPLLSVGGVPCRKVAPRVLRFTAPGGRNYRFGRLRTGDRIAIRYSLWGGGLITFSNVEGAVVRDVAIERCIAMGVVVDSRSSDFTFERFRIAPPEESSALFSSNADGIHVLSLSGKLKLVDCVFRGLGDDALNVHSRAGIVKSCDPAGGEMMCISRGYNGEESSLSPAWASSGDRLAVYDPKTFLKKGELTVVSFSGGRCRFSGAGFPVVAGDLLSNRAFAPSVEIDGCECRSMRARGFLLQTDRVRVRDCRFLDVALPGLLFAPDIERWFEMGPSTDVAIESCVFERCAAIEGGGFLAAVDFKTGHNSRPRTYPPGVHSRLRISGCEFLRCGGAAVSIASASGVELLDNFFAGCGVYAYDPENPQNRTPVRLLRCDKVRRRDRGVKNK